MAEVAHLRVEEGFGHTPLVKDEDRGSKDINGLDQKEQTLVQPQKTKRVATLDAFRGLTIVVKKSLI